MELRHLRYFVAVAEEGVLTSAAEKRLHVAQPSLSRQLRDLEREVGTPLFIRSARGMELTPAGKAFLEPARIALKEAGEAVAAARRAAKPGKHRFSVAFLAGQEVDWLPHVTQALQKDLYGIDFQMLSMFSPDVGDAIQSGEVDLGFCRIEPRPDVTYEVIAQEPIVAILPSDHPLAEEDEIDPKGFELHPFIGYSDTPHVLREIVANYFRDCGISVTPEHLLDNAATGLTLVASTRSVTLLPRYVEPLLPWSVVCRPLKGKAPVIDLAVGYRKDNPSPVLKRFLGDIERLIASGPAGRRLYSQPR
ncbi:transcriptional regulator [Acuticoccus sediminis]|uniref:Transcriptional regulator n=2 Tax=Acuticoccus sediminis TaxID=2184697 RepID=A0A8B2NFN2_9HYPH|nr:transcriptional regulator [Acuticoccus sediminis]